MRASLQFPLDDWHLVLPKEAVSLCDGLEEKDLRRWTLVPPAYWPVQIKDIRNRFWTAMKEGKDTRNLSSYLTDELVTAFYTLASETPSILACVLSIDVSPADCLSSFYQQLLTSVEEVLRIPNVQHGEVDNKLVASKVKAFSTSKNMAQGMGEVVKNLNYMGGVDGTPQLEIKPGEGDIELEGIVAPHQEVDLKKEKDLSENLDRPQDFIEGVIPGQQEIQ